MSSTWSFGARSGELSVGKSRASWLRWANMRNPNNHQTCHRLLQSWIWRIERKGLSSLAYRIDGSRGQKGKSYRFLPHLWPQWIPTLRKIFMLRLLNTTWQLFHSVTGSQTTFFRPASPESSSRLVKFPVWGHDTQNYHEISHFSLQIPGICLVFTNQKSVLLVGIVTLPRTKPHQQPSHSERSSLRSRAATDPLFWHPSFLLGTWCLWFDRKINKILFAILTLSLIISLPRSFRVPYLALDVLQEVAKVAEAPTRCSLPPSWTTPTNH